MQVELTKISYFRTYLKFG